MTVWQPRFTLNQLIEPVISGHLEQSELLKHKFVQKGYREATINQEIKKIQAMPCEHCLKNKKIINKNTKQWCFISDYHCQYKEVEIIFWKHWQVLLLDRTSGPVLPKTPLFHSVYRRAQNLGNK